MNDTEHSDIAASTAQPTLTTPAPVGQYSWLGGGSDVFGELLLQALLTIVTCGFARNLGYTNWRSAKFDIERRAQRGERFRFEGTWSEMLGRLIISGLLLVVSCGFAYPWVHVWHLKALSERTVTHTGARLRFDGEAVEVIGLYILSVFGLLLTLGLAWPWFAVAWRKWEHKHTIVNEPDGRSYRLRFDGSGLSFLVQALLSFLLVLLTLGLYFPWALAQWRRWVWSGTSDELSQPVPVRAGPETPAQWAAAVAAACGVLLLMGTGTALALHARSAHDGPVPSETNPAAFFPSSDDVGNRNGVANGKNSVSHSTGTGTGTGHLVGVDGLRPNAAAPRADGLASEDRGFVDSRNGRGWGDRCFLHIKAGRLDYAEAACARGLEQSTDSWARGALLYNLGQIAEKRGDLDKAKGFYEQSLAIRPSGPGSQATREKLAAVSSRSNSAAQLVAASHPALPAGDAPPDMVLVPPGTFSMGSDDGKGSERPSRLVTLSHAFYLDRTEVTSGAYQRCVDSGTCTATSIHGPAATPKSLAEQSQICTGADPARANYPINCIDRAQAVTYCSSLGRRLPTDAEWEYAARGTDQRVFPWGEESPTGCDVAITGGCIKHLCEVGQRPRGASPFGALDMAGNVWEWVADGWSDAPASAGTTDPALPPGNFLGVLRGGSWDFGAPSAHGYSRLKFSVASGHVSTGVRCARDAGR